MAAAAVTVLSNYSLRNTQARASVLEVFLENSHALSHADIEKTLNNDFDRVTLYRTINLFLEKGIIHKVIDDSGSTKYAACADECSDGHHHDNHVHFKCSTCGQSECITSVKIPALSLPKGYQVSAANLLIEGVCKNCG